MGNDNKPKNDEIILLLFTLFGILIVLFLLLIVVVFQTWALWKVAKVVVEANTEQMEERRKSSGFGFFGGETLTGDEEAGIQGKKRYE